MLQKNNIRRLHALFREDPDRVTTMRVGTTPWMLDYSGLPVAAADFAGRLATPRVQALDGALESLFSGAIVNPGEQRAATHPALRATDPAAIAGASDGQCIADSRQRMLAAAAALHAGETEIRDLIHVGIGGSELGPRLVTRALDAGDGAVRVHWLAGLDAARLSRLLATLDPARTGMVVASKSFTTAETMCQARAVREWLGADFAARTWAATARPERAREFGIRAERILAFPDSVGGRFSLWSPVGLAAAARIGPERWQQLLAGAERADREVRAGTAAERLPVVLAAALDLLRRDAGLSTLGVISYEPRLAWLVPYVQQLVMESLGKGVTVDGSTPEATAPLVFGGTGTELQHSIFQALHQAGDRHPLLLVGSCRGDHDRPDWQDEQLAHLLGQARVLTGGFREGPSERHAAGEHPVLVLLTPELDSQGLGWLLAGLEHTVYLLGTLWQVNPFDQWGVEAGKRLAADCREALAGDGEAPDGRTRALLAYIRSQRRHDPGDSGA